MKNKNTKIKYDKGYWTLDNSSYADVDGNIGVRKDFSESITDESFYTLSVESARQSNGLQIRDSSAFDFVNGEIFPDGNIVVPAGRKPFADIVDAQNAVKDANNRLRDSLYDDSVKSQMQAKERQEKASTASEAYKNDLVQPIKNDINKPE